MTGIVSQRDDLPLFPARRQHPAMVPDVCRRAARLQIREKLSALEAKVLNAIAAAGPEGLIDHEIAEVCELLESTARARRVCLMWRGLIVATGERRKTPSGRSAAAWRVQEALRIVATTEGGRRKADHGHRST